MERRWTVYPDHHVVIGGEAVEAVSREAMREAYADAEAIQAQMGGVITCMVGRRKTDLSGEAVTTGAIFEWKSSLNAPASPEREVEILPAAANPDPTPEELEQQLAEQEAIHADLAEAQQRAMAVEPDGLDPATLEDEDVSAIPVEQR